MRCDLLVVGEFVLTALAEPRKEWREADVLPGCADAEPEPDDSRLVADVPDWLRTDWVISCTASSLNPHRHFPF